MNDQNRKRMDFGAGRRQMSPEMIAAQRRLAEKQAGGTTNQSARITRTQSGRTASGATFTHTRTIASYSASRPAQTSRPAQAPRPPKSPRPAISARPAKSAARPARPRISPDARLRAAKAPAQNPAAPRRPHAPRKEPTGPVSSSELETVEFDALSSLTVADAPLEAASAPTEPPAARTAENADKKHNRPEKPSEKPKKGFLGDKSPFINTLNIEKRPLSGHTVNKKKSLAPKSPKPEAYTPPNDNVPTMVSNKRKNRKSNIALAIAIFLTVILGAVVGTFVYLAFFQ